MEKAFTFAVAIAVSLGTTALLANSRRARPEVRETFSAQWSTDGAFRDGLYLGKLSASTGRPFRPPVGRWSTEKDRNSFAAGYRQGYADVFAAAERPHFSQTAREMGHPTPGGLLGAE